MEHWIRSELLEAGSGACLLRVDPRPVPDAAQVLAEGRLEKGARAPTPLPSSHHITPHNWRGAIPDGGAARVAGCFVAGEAE